MVLAMETTLSEKEAVLAAARLLRNMGARDVFLFGSAMLNSFYTEIEKILKLIARAWDEQVPSSDAWHKELLNQMVVATSARPAVISSGLVDVLSEFLAFRHLFRGASIALMGWDK